MQFNLLVFVLLCFEAGFGTDVAKRAVTRVTVKHVMGNAVLAYIAVEKQAVQERLNTFNNRAVNGPQLYLPTKPIFKDFKDILTSDHHVINIAVGSLDSFDSHREKATSSDGMQVSVFIPFLADHPDGDLKYNLDIGQFHQRGRDTPGGRVILPYFGIDELKVTETGAVLRNGSDELRMSFVRSNPCQAPSSIRSHEFDVLLEEEFTISFSPKIDLSFCDQYSVADDQSCEILKSIKPGLEEESSNVCEFLSKGSQIEKCKASFTLTNITNGFRKLLLLDNSPINVVASESVVGDYYANIKYPCIE